MKRWKDCKVRSRNLKEGSLYGVFPDKIGLFKASLCRVATLQPAESISGSRIGISPENGYFTCGISKVAAWLCAH